MAQERRFQDSPDFRKSGVLENRSFGFPEIWIFGNRISAISEILNSEWPASEGADSEWPASARLDLGILDIQIDASGMPDFWIQHAGFMDMLLASNKITILVCPLVNKSRQSEEPEFRIPGDPDFRK